MGLRDGCVSIFPSALGRIAHGYVIFSSGIMLRYELDESAWPYVRQISCLDKVPGQRANPGRWPLLPVLRVILEVTI